MMLLMALVCLPKVVLADELTVNDGTTTNAYVPVYGTWVDSYTRQQFIVPADDLADMVGGTINSLTFYSSTDSKSWGNARWTISLGETTVASLSANYQSVSDVVYTGAISIANGELTITFATPYAYSGDNLVVDFSQTAKGTYSSASFYGVSGTSVSSRYGYNGSGASAATGTPQAFCPKVKFDYDPAATGGCARVGKPVVSGLASDSARITWAKGGSESEWLVKLGDAEYVSVSDTTYLFENLNPNTSYSFEVRAFCAEGDTAKAVKGSFKTDCGVITNFPWFEDFESYSNGKFTDPCWGNEWVNKNSPDLTRAPWSISATSAASGTHSIYGYYQSSKDSWANLVLPQMDIPEANNYEFKFTAYRSTGTSYLTDEVRVFVNSTPDTIGAQRLLSVHRIYTEAPAEEAAGHYQYAATIPNAGLQYIILQYFSHDGMQFYLDDFIVREIPSCRPSKDLHFVESDFTTATFAWTSANGETEWQLQYKADGATSYDLMNLNEPTVTLTGLTSGTAYKGSYILHSVCDGELSPDSVRGTLVFNTECETVLPENDSIVFGAEGMTSVMTPCYQSLILSGNLSDKWSASSYAAHSGGMGFTISGSASTVAWRALVLPKVSIDENWEVSFYHKVSSVSTHAYADTILIYMNNTPSLEGAELLGVVTDLAKDWKLGRAPITGRGEKYIILAARNYSSLYIDDIVLAPLPSCLPVADIEMDPIEQMEGEDLFQVRFHWTPGGEETLWSTSYEIKVDTVGAPTDTIGSADDWEQDEPEFILPELEPNTNYIVKMTVWAGCDDGAFVSVPETKEFLIHVPCLPIQLVETTPGDTVFVENFDDDATITSGTTFKKECYEVIAQTTSGALNYNTSYKNSGTHALALTSSSYATYKRVLVLPAMNIGNASDYTLSFMARRYWTASYYDADDSIAVYMNSEPSLEGATYLGSTGLMTSSSYERFAFDLKENGLQYVMLQLVTYCESSSYTNYTLVDDIAIVHKDNCRKVQDVKVENITKTSATLTWDPAYEETEWHVIVKKGGVTLVDDTVSENSLVIDTLQSAHRYIYNVTVKAHCDGVDAKEFFSGNVTIETECDILTQFPISYGFESKEGFTSSSLPTTNTLPLCWGTEEISFNGTTGAGRLWGANTTNKHTGSMSLCLPDKGATTAVSKTLLSFPGMHLEDGKDYELNFWVYRNGTYSGDVSTVKPEGFRIYVSNSAELDASAVELGLVSRHPIVASAAVPAEEATGWYRYTIDFPISGDVYLYFMGESYYGSATYVDDIVIREKPVCDGATALHAVDSLATTSSVTFAWSGNSDAGYDVKVCSATDTIVAQVADTFYVVNNLSSGKAYTFDVQVVAVCSAGAAVDTLAMKGMTFMTLCETVAALPYEEDFESWVATNNSMPACWDAIKVSNSSTTLNNVMVYNSVSYVKDGKNSLYFTMEASRTDYLYAIMPEFSADLSGAEIKFSYKMESATNSGLLDFGYLTDATSGSSFVSLSSCTRRTTWADVTVALAGVPEGARMAFRYGNSGSSYTSQYYMGIDNIMIREIPTCLPATKLHVVDSLATASSVAIAWTPNNEDNLNARVIVTLGEDTIANELVNDSIYHMPAPSSWGATIHVDVITVCDAQTSVDILSGNLNVHTLCAPITIGEEWKADFENKPYMGCWTLGNGATIPLSTSYKNSGETALQFNKQNDTVMVVLPEFAEDLATMEMSYGWRCEGTGASLVMGYLEAGYVTDADNLGSFVAINNHNYHVFAYEIVDMLLAGVPQGARLAFRYTGQTGNYYLYIDDISVHPAPSCARPGTVNVVEIGQDTATLAWTGDAAQYELIIKNAAGADTILVADTCYVLRGLTPATKYVDSVWVRSYCDAENISRWSDLKVLTFTTECAPLTSLPYTVDFEDMETNKLPVCWYANTASAYPSSTTSHDGSKSFYVYGSSTDDRYVVLPEFDESVELDGAKFSFWYKNYSTSASYGHFEVGTMSNPEDASTYVKMAEFTPKTSFTLGQADLLGVPADHHYVVIAYPQASYAYYSQYFDDITILPAPNCKKVRDLRVDTITTSSVRFAWTPSGNESEWLVEVYKGATRLDSVAVAAPVFEIDTLQPETAYSYTIKVAASCGEGELSEMISSTFNVTTKPTCLVPSNIRMATIGVDSAVVVWEGAAGQYEMILKQGTAAADTMLLTDNVWVVRNLTPATSYSLSVKLRAICQEGDSSKWASATLKFTTECVAITSLPWNEGFESYSIGFANGLPVCWEALGCNEGSASTYPVAYVNSSTGYYHSGSKSLYFQSGAGKHAVAVLPPFGVDLSGAEMEFWYRNEGATLSNGTLSVGYVTDAMDATSFVALRTLEQKTSMTNVLLSLSDVPEGARLAFDYLGGTSNNYYLGIDDITVRVVPTCFKATNIHVVDSTITTSSAVIAWSAPAEGGSQFKVEVKNGETVLKDNVLVNDTFLLVEDLNPSTSYSLSVAVTTVCGAGDESEAVQATVAFATECDMISVFPWSTDFEAYSTGSFNNVPCFSTEAMVGQANDWEVASGASNAHGGSKYAYIKYTGETFGRTEGKLNLPTFNLVPGETYVLNYWIKASTSASSDTARVWVNDVCIKSLHTKNDIGGVYVEMTDTIIGDGETVISFSFNNLDGYFLYLDDVTVDKVVSEGPATGIDHLGDAEEAEKILYNGQVYIRRGKKVYSVLGQQVK